MLENKKFSYKKTPDQIKIEMMRSSSSIAGFIQDRLENSPETWVSKEIMYEVYAEYVSKEKLPLETLDMLGKKLPKFSGYITHGKLGGKNNQVTGWRNVKIINKK